MPILIAPPAPDEAEIAQASQSAAFTGNFRRDLKGSDFLHWGEGDVSVSSHKIAHKGKLAPGPDYKLYLSPELVTNEKDFARLKSKMALVGNVKGFQDFLVPVPESVDPGAFDSVIVWCESFGEFITAARYR